MGEHGISPAVLLPQIRSKGKSDRYSENLAKWVKKWSKTRHNVPLHAVFIHWSNIDGSFVEKVDGKTQAQQILIGRLDGDGWFYGSRLSGILGNGGRETVFAWPRKFELTLLPTWFEEYAACGKCFIDPEHRLYYDRWQVLGDGQARQCLWCGDYTQRKVVTQRIVEDVSWTKEASCAT